MTLASSWTDLVVGVDIHLHMVPTPGGPVPTPIPQPFMGLVGDPVGMIVGALTTAAISLVQSGRVSLPSGPVLINGLPATTTDELGKNLVLLPHVPMPPGTAHVKKPSGEAKLPLGVLKIAFGGASPVPLGQMAISCGDPPLPTSKIVVIPKGPPVLVLGNPGVDVSRAVAKWAMGKVVRTSFKAASATAKRVAKLAGPRLRNAIPKNKCTKTGHPVDVANGRVFTSAVDFELPGQLPVVFERTYFSSWAHRNGVLGPGWSHAYDQAVWAEERSVVYRNGEGQEIVFDADPVRLERRVEVFDPQSRNVLERTKDGWRVVSPEGLVHHFARVPGETDSRPGMTRIARITTRDPEVGIACRYDEQARLRALVDSAGRVIKLDYDAHHRLASISLPHPEAAETWVPHVRFSYSREGLLADVADAAAKRTRYEYDGGLIVQETDRNGVSFFWIYDGASSGARCVRTWGQSGDEVIYNQKLDYDLANRATLVTDSYGQKTLYRMNELGAVVEVVDPLGGVTTREYDEAGQLLSETDPEGRTTRHHLGPRGQLLMTVLPDGGQRVWKYHPRFPELVKLFRTEAGAVWRHRYDAEGRLVETRGPERDAHVLYEWQRGRLSAVVSAGGRTEVVERDAHGNATVVRLPTGGLIRKTYDRRGRIVGVTNPYGAAETRRYDELDRLRELVQAEGTRRTFSYDAEGNLIEAVDPHRRVRCTYSNWNRLASREEADANGARGDVVRFIWGAEGELRELRNERNHAYEFHYDPCLRLEREVGFDLQETRYKRDRSGWVVQIAKPKAGVHTTLKLDPCGRILESTNSDGTFARFAYRKDGEIIEATNQTTTVTFQRDLLGRVTKEIQGDIEVRSFFVGGYRSRLESTLGAGFGISRDGAGNPITFSTQLSDRGWTSASTQAYDDAGLEARRELPGGVAVEWRRDGAGRPLGHAAGRADAYDWYRSYDWGSDDRLTAIGDSRFGRSTFVHDFRGRLISEARDGGEVIHRAFDEVGNVYRTPDRSDRRYVRGGIIRNDGEVTFGFDLLGNLVEKHEPRGTWRYHWSGDGMLTKVERPDGVVVEMAYDALGRRVSKKVGERETRWIWDGDVILHEIKPERPTVTWYHEPESFTPVLRVEDGRVRHHVVADHLGTPTAIYDEGGRQVWHQQLDVFGVPRQVGDAELCAFRWPGQVEDAETGLYYNRFRYYEPKLGLFARQDPAGLAGGLRTYGYVADPATWIDPRGLTGTCGSAPGSPTIVPDDLIAKTRSEIRILANQKGLIPVGAMDDRGLPRKWKDPITGKQRLRLDRGHIDATTGKPYDLPSAAVDHVHGYQPDGATKIRDPLTNDPHFPTTGD